MAVLLSEIPESLAGETLPHKTWTRAELEVLESTALLEGRRFELIEGELIDKMRKKRKDVSSTAETARVLRGMFGEEYVNTEAPIDIAPEDNATNEPEPDVIVLRRTSRSLAGNPAPDDLALVVEIADSTLRQDLTAKARLYARARIEEYWVVDLNHRRLHILRDPAEGGYRVRIELGEGDSVSPKAKPGQTVAVAAMLP